MPRRTRLVSRWVRWPANLAVVALNTVVLRLTFPTAAVGLAPIAAHHGWGLLNATAMFNHGNVSLPRWLDRRLRWIVVTPDMHRVHHSVVPNETNSNFGFNLPWWNRLLGTYRAQPAAGHEGMTTGLNTFHDPKQLRLDRMLIQPFVGSVGAYPINSRDTGR